MLKPVDKAMSPQLENFLGVENLYSSAEPDAYQKYAVVREVVRQHELDIVRLSFRVQTPETDVLKEYCIRHQCTEREAVMGLAPKHYCTEDELFGTLKPVPNPVKMPAVTTPDSLGVFPYPRSLVPLSSGLQFRGYWCVPANINVDGKDYRCRETTHLNSPQGLISGGITHYHPSDGMGMEVQVPLCSVLRPLGPFDNSYFLTPGFSPVHKKLIYADQIEKMKPDGIVFLCPDLRIAKILDGIIKDSRRYEPGMFVATSWYGGGRLMKGVNAGALWGRNIVLLPAISRESFFSIWGLSAHLKKLGARTVRILPMPVLYRRPKAAGSEAQNILAGTDSWERFMVEEAVTISDRESLILKAFDEWAIDEDSYIRWAIGHGLLYEQNQDRPRPSGFLPALSPSELSRRIGSSQVPHSINTSAFGQAGQTTLIYGATNSSKSMVAIAVATAKATGKGILGFEPELPQRVLIVDAETDETLFVQRIHRNRVALNASAQLLDENLKLKHLKSEQYEGAASASLTEQDCLESLKNVIVKDKITTVVLDNLICLLPGFRQKSHSLWTNFVSWMSTMEKEHKVAFIIIHHSNQSEDAAGTKDIEAQCQNVILIEGRAKLMSEADKANSTPAPAVSAFIGYFSREGVLSRVTFKKCKAFPELEMKPFGVFLEYAPEKPSEGEPWHRIQIDSPFSNALMLGPGDNLVADTGKSIQAKYQNLTGNERKVMELAHGQPSFTRMDVEERLKCHSSKAGGIIKALKASGYLDENGQGKAITYCLRPSQDEPSPSQP